MPYILRDYQDTAVDAVLEDFKRVNSTAIIHATGLGKTPLAAEVVLRYKPRRTLFLAPQAQLVWQAKKKFEFHTGLNCETEMNIERATRDVFNMAPIIIGTVQTQYARNNARVFDPKDIDLLILDELHHYTSPALRGVVNHYKQNPNIKILGLTATPKRTDEAALKQIVDSVAHIYELNDAKDDGYLVNVKQLFVPVDGLDFSHLHTIGDDFKKDELNAILEEEKIVQRMIQATCEIVWRVPKDSLKGKPPGEWDSFLRANGKPRRSIVFCASVKQAEMFSAILNRAVRGSSEWVCDKTHETDRARILDSFSKNQELHIVCNVGILGEGYDNPLVEVTVHAKPTKSLLWYQQAIGRSTRTLEGVIDGLNTKEARLAAIAKSAKTHATTVDFVGNCGRHKLVSSIDILGGKVSEEVLERAIKIAQEKGEEVAVDQLIIETEETIKREADKRKEQAERSRQAWEKRRKILATSTYRVIEVPAFKTWGLKEVRERGWDNGRQLSDGQKAVLANAGIDFKGLTYGECRVLVDEEFRRRREGLCTFRQAEKLRAMGLSIDITWQEAAKVTNIPACTPKQAWKLRSKGYNPMNYTVETASKLISQLNNGQKPVDQVVPPKKLNGEPATDGQKKFLGVKFHYNTALLTKKEATRLFLRIKKNGFHALPLTDHDHPKNWKEPVEQVEVEAEPELVVQEDMF